MTHPDDEEETHATIAMNTALGAEFHLLEEFLEVGAFTHVGLDQGYRFCTREHNIVAGNLSVVRERVLDKFIVALASSTGFPESYWRDRTDIDVPDDLSGLDDGGTA